MMRRGSAARVGAPPPGVERPWTTANYEQKRQPEKHTVVGPGFVGGGPEATFREHRNLGRCDRNDDVDEEWYRCQPRHQPDDKEETATDLDATDERSRESRNRNPDSREAPDAQGNREEKLLDALGEKDGANLVLAGQERDPCECSSWLICCVRP